MPLTLASKAEGQQFKIILHWVVSSSLAGNAQDPVWGKKWIKVLQNDKKQKTDKKPYWTPFSYLPTQSIDLV